MRAARAGLGRARLPLQARMEAVSMSLLVERRTACVSEINAPRLRTRRRRGVRAGIACGLIAIACPLAQAGSVSELGAMSLDSLLDVEVTAASKFPQRIGESASSATVISAAEIRALGFRTLAEALASIRGLSVGSDRTYAYLGVRGLSAPGDYNTRVLLLIDGIRVNDSVYDQAMLGSEFPLDLSVVDSIEFIPGQGSAIHGANALFGVVNVVTRKIAGRDEARAGLVVGSGRSSAGSAMLNLAGSEGRGLLLSATVGHSDGHDLYYPGYDTPETNHGVSTGADGERANKLLLKLDGGNGLSGLLIYSDRWKGLPAAIGTIFGDSGNRYRDTTTLASVTLDTRLDDATELRQRLYTGRYDFEGDYRVDYAPGTLNVDTAKARWWGLESSAVTTRLAGHKLAFGADLQWTPHRDQSNFDATEPPAVYLDDHRSARSLSFFAEDQVELSTRFSLTAGARYDRTTGDGIEHSAFSPRLAAVFRPDERSVLKYIYGAAFRPPNAYEADYAIPGEPPYKANPALRNESVRGHEIALEYRPAPSARWLVSVYSNQARDLIVQTTDPADGALVFRNQGSLRTTGIEIEGEWLLPNGARIRANASGQHVGDAAGGDVVSTAPRRLANLMVTWPLGAAWNLGLHSALVGRRGEAAGYGTTSLTLSTAAPWRGWDASLSMYNVFDRHATDPGSDPVFIPTVPQDGRSLRLQFEHWF